MSRTLFSEFGSFNMEWAYIINTIFKLWNTDEYQFEMHVYSLKVTVSGNDVYLSLCVTTVFATAEPLQYWQAVSYLATYERLLHMSLKDPHVHFERNTVTVSNCEKYYLFTFRFYFDLHLYSARYPLSMFICA